MMFPIRIRIILKRFCKYFNCVSKCCNIDEHNDIKIVCNKCRKNCKCVKNEIKITEL